MANRKYNVQHLEEPGLQPGTQLRTGEGESQSGLCNLDVVGLFGGADATVVLRAISGGLEESSAKDQECSKQSEVLSRSGK